jgi:hypothetical protein
VDVEAQDAARGERLVDAHFGFHVAVGRVSLDERGRDRARGVARYGAAEMVAIVGEKLRGSVDTRAVHDDGRERRNAGS